jgi:hypothetical protein
MNDNSSNVFDSELYHSSCQRLCVELFQCLIWNYMLMTCCNYLGLYVCECNCDCEYVVVYEIYVYIYMKSVIFSINVRNL